MSYGNPFRTRKATLILHSSFTHSTAFEYKCSFFYFLFFFKKKKKQQKLKTIEGQVESAPKYSAE